VSEEPARYGNHDPIVNLRLELGREKARADAFEAALRKEVLTVIARQNEKTLDGADIATWKLRSDNWQKLVQIATKERDEARADVSEFEEYLKWTGHRDKFAEFQEWRRQKSDGGKEGCAS
jgi:hypothetical protein